MAMRRRSCDGEAYPSDLVAWRLRIRRIHRFLKNYGFLDPAAVEVEKATGVFFDVGYLHALMLKGCWDKAHSYVVCFLPGYRPRSRQALDLLVHLGAAKMLAAVAAGGGRDAAVSASTFDRASEPHLARCRDVLHQMHADQPRASKLWRDVEPYAVSAALDMVAKCPELKGKLCLPRNRTTPWEITPLIRARRSQRRRSNAADRTPVDVLTRAFLRQQWSLSVQETNAAYSGGPSPMTLFIKIEKMLKIPSLLEINIMVKSKSSWSQIVKDGRPKNMSVSTRNLQPQDLGAVIFGCTNNTIAECHSRQLFGLPRAHLSYVQNIKEGLPLFLFNYDDRRLHGIYEAASDGKFCPESKAWSHDGKGKTSYPAQVAMRIRMWCFPLEESQFRNVIHVNYYQKMPGVSGQSGQKLHFFQFELDHAQTHALMDMFTPSPSPNNFWTPTFAAPGHKHVTELISPPDCEGNDNIIKPEKVAMSYADVVNKNKFEEVGTGDVDAVHSSSSNESSNGFDDLDCGDTPPEVERCALLKKEAQVQQQQSRQQDKELSLKRLLEKLKIMSAQQRNNDFCANATETEGIDIHSFQDMQEVKSAFLEGHSNLPENLDAEVNQLSWKHSKLLEQSLDAESWTEAKLTDVVKELSGRIAVMEKKQVWSNKEVKYLQGVNEKLLKRVVELKGTVKTLNSKIDPLTLDDSLNQFVEQCLGSEDVIYLVGGFDGFSFLPSLDSFSPSLDILTPLKPMTVGKSYASTVALDGKIFVLGGGDGACWFDTVDCYDRRRDDWTSCPSLTHEKGSLAGVSLNGKIYAFGGGDGSECFSDVELFDPAHGKWIKSQPMLEKRFALAGVELNGVIYAVGGFNGVQYLRSAERLDPREPNWKRLPMMSTGRGCHTVAVLDEKIFAIGGYDPEAKAMVATVELYEPRMPSWVTVEPMSYTRGYHSSAELGGSIFTFGGVKGEADTILDVVERYKEGCGWVTTGLKSIGRRCYCSAIVL